MGSLLGFGVANPALLWGGLLVASPIIIHLLSKRRFRILDWAAMDFVLEAERRNRRRIRLEHLILLLLRCLAVLLATLLVARLLARPGGLLGAVANAPVEHVVLLDDSPSLDARAGRGTVFDQAKQVVAALARHTARERPGDSLTLVLTSQPTRPVLNGQFLSRDRAEAAAALVEALAVSDRAAEFDTALLAIEELLATSQGSPNRDITIVTDLRRRDWAPAPTGQPPGKAAGKAPADPAGRGVVGLLRRLAERTLGVTLVDVGGAQAANLAVAEIAVRDKAVVADVPTTLEVVVANYGDADAADVPVALTPGTSMPLRATIARVPAGERAGVPFSFTFRQTGPTPVRAEIPADVLPRDNARHAVVRVRKGVNVALVDGEPALSLGAEADTGEGETFYLQRALSPPGDVPSGNDVHVLSENQFEGALLDRFQVIVLANVYRLTESRRTSLEQWVRNGGGLVVFLGDQVDDLYYNEKLYARGKGLLPVALGAVRGDMTPSLGAGSAGRWVHLGESSANHPVLRVFAGAHNPFLRRVKFFRWWETTPDAEALRAGRAHVLATFDTPAAAPAMVEQRFGKGRVVVVTTSADAEWTNWPADPSYLVTVLELVRHAMAPAAGELAIGVGVPLRMSLDPSRFASTVRIEPPGADETRDLQAFPAEDGKSLSLRYDGTTRQGIYRLHLERRDGSEETDYVAVNIHPTEGDLRPADHAALRRALGDAKVAIVPSGDFLPAGAADARAELWRGVLVALVLALCVEQTLAWWFGRRRT